MYLKMGKLKTVLFAISVFLTSAAVMWQNVMIVVVNELYIAFPQDEALVTALLAWPGLLSAITSILTGFALEKLTTKQELIIACLLMLTGVVTVFSQTTPVLLITTLLMAIGVGFANTAGMSIISEVFIKESIRSKMMGFYSATMAASGAALSVVAGQLALNGWMVAYNAFWWAAVMLVLTIIFVPNIKPADRYVEPVIEDNPALVNDKPFGGFFWAFSIGMFIFFSLYAGGPLLNCSIYVAENNLGDVAFVGLCSSLSTVGSCICCILFGFLYEKIHRKYALITIPALMLVMAYMVYFPSPIGCAVTQLLSGGCYGTTFSLMFAYCAEIVPISKNGRAMGVCTFATTASFTLGVYFYTFMQSLFNITFTQSLLCGVVGLVIPLVIEIAFIKKTKEKRELTQAAEAAMFAAQEQ